MLISALIGVLFCACSESKVVISVDKNTLFSIGYGNFEDELNLFTLSGAGPVNTRFEMRDGFFYVSNAESKKIMDLNSYGDLIGLYYNADTNPAPSFAAGDDGEAVLTATRKAVEYPFNALGPITVDSRKYVYAADKLPAERQEQDVAHRLLLSQIVLRFSSEGTFVDYIGQQGPGGTPFPYIKNLYTTKNNELIVVCQTNDGITVYWFNDAGYLLYTIPFVIDSLPNPLKAQTDMDMFVSLEKIIPAYTGRTLYVKIDYYTSTVDEASQVQSGIDYTGTLLYPLDVETGEYGEPLSIPPYEEVVSDGFTRLVYPLSYDFLGVTESGWLFFIIADDTGYTVQMIQSNGQKILKRHLDVDHSEILYNTFAFSPEGIISALFAKNRAADVVWWRTDLLVDAILKG
ncbi:putative lipoprotein [Treponema brennaborense DSM 12168]|uniref:Lipoprotein n=2 Tax=Treponema TaxID=157 RepID=F4LM57_TREBD|nr:putative lipoprotein [Treponema brennaborense DSM 12168]